MTAVDHLYAAVQAAGIGLWDWSLSQARLNLVRAQYQLALAYVAMQRSMGQQ